MRFMKSKAFISIILIFVLCTSCTCVGFAYFSDIEDTPYKQDILDLYELGIIYGTEEGMFKPDDTLTRAEFCAILARLNGFDSDSVVSDKQYFADVSQEHLFFDEIGFAASRSFVNGYPDGNFHPDEYISYDQVNKIMIEFLGYKYLADVNGGYPIGYRVAANSLDLSDGLDLSYEININRGELCKYINNALDVPLVEMIGLGEDGIYEINEDKTILTQYLKLKKVEGFVDANSFFGLNDSEADDNCIMIDGVNYRITDNSLNTYVGKYVTAVVKIDESKKYEEIVTVKEEENTEILLTHENYIHYDNYTLSYDTADNKQKSVRIASDLKLIYNGEEKVFDKSYINNLTNGTVRLISKNQSSVYDVIIVSSYTSLVVDRKNEHNKVVYDPSGLISLDFSEDIVYNITNSDNKAVSFDEISEGSVITYFKNGKYAEGFVTNYTVSGTLSELGEENGTPCAVINNEKIKLNTLAKTGLESYGPGSYVKLYIDAFDYAVFAEKVVVNTDKIKYLFKLANSSDTALDSTLMGKFYDLDNGIEIFEFARDVRLNGTTIKNAKASDVNLSIPQMVQIKLNDENKITSITTAKSYEEFMTNPGTDGFCEVFAFKSRTFHVDSDSFDNKILFKQNSTKIMIVPEDMSNYTDKDFKTVTSASFTNSGSYNVAAYNSSADYVIPEIIVCKMSANQSTNITLSKSDRLFTISGISQVTNEDGDVLTKVTGFVGSSETFFYIDPEDTIVDKYDDTLNVNDLVVGDIIFCNRNSDKYIKAFTRFYNKQNGYTQKITYKTLDQAIVIMHSEARKIAEPYIYFLDEAGDNSYDYYMFKSGSNVTVVSQNRNGIEVSGGTLADIDIGDEIIVHIRYTIVDGIVVFKK